MRLFDSHCHLDFPDFDADRGEVLARARAVGVVALLVPGYTLAGWPCAGGQRHVEGAREDARRGLDLRALVVEAAAQGVHVHVAVGVHPYALAESDPDAPPLPEGELASRLVQAATQHGAVAIGECGLDAPLARRAAQRVSRVGTFAHQEAVLREHLLAAQATRLPVVLHVVRAHERALTLLRAVPPIAGGDRPAGRGVVHAYSGSAELAGEYARLGFMLAFGGALTHTTHARAREVARVLPDEQLLVESDAPSGRLLDGPARNEPCAVRAVVEALAQLRGQTSAHVADVTRRNALALFGSPS